MKSKKVVVLLLTAILVISTVFATGSKEEEKIAEDKLTVSAPGVFPIVEEKTTLNVFISQLSAMLTDVTTNTFTREFEELTNVQLDMLVVPESGRTEKLNLLLASGDYPEVIMSAAFSNADLVRYGTEEGILIPLNDLIEEHGVNIKERWADNPHFEAQMITPDGNIYGIPSAEAKTGHGAVGYKLWLNEAWLENLNLDKPTTTEEFKSVLQAFKTQDPNGNGKADEIPITGATGTWAADIHLYLLNAFGYFDESLVKLQDDTFTGCANTVEMQDGLRYIRDLYNEGLIDPAALTQNAAQLAAIGNNADDVIVGAASCGHVGMLLSINDVERASMYTALEPLEGPNGYRGIPYSYLPNVAGANIVITDKCEQPEVAMKLIDALAAEDLVVRSQVGIKGTHWDDADSNTFGMDGITPAKYKYLSYQVSGEGASENDVWVNTTRVLEPYWKGLFQVDGEINDPTNYEARLQRETEKLLPYAADVQQVPPLWMNEDDSARLSQLSGPLKDYVKVSIVEFITSKKDIDTDWNAYLEGLEGLRYDEYIMLQQTAYDAQTK